MARETQQEKLVRMTQLELPYWVLGQRVAGIDEVGRGPLAGPVVTACVVMDPDRLIGGVDDSKKLSENRREALYDQIVAAALYIGLGRVEAAEIDEINILQATRKAMEEAARAAGEAVFFVDAVEGLRLPGPSEAIVKGDQKSYSIAAASIVAKVTRDRFMREMDAVYPQYGFARHKGYGTAEHMRAIAQYGICPLHRRSFLKGFAL